MSFTRPIQQFVASGRVCSRVVIPLTVPSPAGAVTRFFRFDTGCDVTTVSEDVATQLGLPAGGPPIRVTGSTATGVGRAVDVEFRFPPDEISGLPGPVVSSTWIVIAGRTLLALVSFHEVHAHFYIGTSDDEMTFTMR
jgi:hypothetical protein